MRSVVLAVAGAAMMIGSVAFAQPVDPKNVWGVWYPGRTDSQMEVRDCGDGTPCGVLVQISASDPTALRDENNPDPALRNNQLLGETFILQGFESTKDAWRRGKVYDPDEGKYYRAAIWLETADVLKMQGCVGVFCQTRTWTRVPEADVAP